MQNTITRSDMSLIKMNVAFCKHFTVKIVMNYQVPLVAMMEGVGIDVIDRPDKHKKWAPTEN